MIDSLISVIVPIYNREKFLDKCIESIVNQSYRNLEIILVNDGSTDNSLDICKKWADNDNRIKIIDKKNGGVSSARNAGLDLATGEYIGFVDGDDFIEEDMYSSLMSYIDSDVDIVCGRLIYYKNFCEVEGTHFKSDSKLYTSDEILNCFFKTQNSEWVSLCNKVFKRNIFEGIQFPDGRVFEDYAISPLLYYRSNKIYYLNKKVYYYIIHEADSIFHNHSIKRYYDCVMNDYDQYLFFINNDCKQFIPSIRFIIRADFRKMCKVYSINRHNRKMINCAFKACLEVCGFRNLVLESIFYLLKPIIRHRDI